MIYSRPCRISDEFTVPLCRTHHRINHRFGDEVVGETSMIAANDLAARRALEAAGVEFIDENGGGPGARLRKLAKESRGNMRIRRTAGSEFEIRPARKNTLGPNMGLW